MLVYLLVAAFAIVPALAGATGGARAEIHLSVVLDFERKEFGADVVRSMQAETAAILRESGVSIDWVSLEESSRRQDLGEILVFKMRGKCAMDSFPVLPDELGMPLAITHSADGEILSFGAVDCDRVRSSLKRTMIGRDYARGDFLFGRALGRVIAHEMYHMLTRTSEHAEEGVTRECLSARELVRDRLMFSDKSLRAIREQLALMKKRENAALRQSSASPESRVPAMSSLP